jgi:hypothetical protein
MQPKISAIFCLFLGIKTLPFLGSAGLFLAVF